MSIVMPKKGDAWRRNDIGGISGALYAVMGLAHDEGSGNVVVVYLGMSHHDEGKMFTSSLSDFLGQHRDHSRRFFPSPAHDKMAWELVA